MWNPHGPPEFLDPGEHFEGSFADARAKEEKPDELTQMQMKKDKPDGFGAPVKKKQNVSAYHLFKKDLICYVDPLAAKPKSLHLSISGILAPTKLQMAGMCATTRAQSLARLLKAAESCSAWKKKKNKKNTGI
jgi:hypothetical protein